MGTYFPACFVPPKARGHTHTQTKAHNTETDRGTHRHTHTRKQKQHALKCCQNVVYCWAEARVKIARMTLTIKLDGNWSSFQLANCAPPLGVTDSAIAPSARMLDALQGPTPKPEKKRGTCLSNHLWFTSKPWHTHEPKEEVTHKQPEPKAILNA